VEVRRGARTCDDPCILGRVLDSAIMQARVRLSCSDSLKYTDYHTFRRQASPPRAATDGVDFGTVPQGRFFSKIIRPNSIPVTTTRARGKPLLLVQPVAWKILNSHDETRMLVGILIEILNGWEI